MDSLFKSFITGQNFTQNPLSTSVLFLIVAWSLFWKGVALWRCANLKQRNWFVAVLILNTAGILEIAYLFYFSRPKLNIQDVFDLIKPQKSKKSTN